MTILKNSYPDRRRPESLEEQLAIFVVLRNSQTPVKVEESPYGRDGFRQFVSKEIENAEMCKQLSGT